MEDGRIRHLELVQGVIGRLGTSSFLIKGWAVTVSGALYAFTANRLDWPLALASLFPVLPFWFLDAFFLQRERLYRLLYDDIRRPGDVVEPFSMDVMRYVPVTPWRSAAVSPTLLAFHGLNLAAGVALFVASLWSG